MNSIILSSLSIATLLTLNGCGGGADVVGSTDTGKATGPVAPPASGEVSPSEFVSVSGIVRAPDGSPLPGVRACLQAGPTIAMDIGDCAMSGSDGSWTIARVPQNLLVTIGLSKEGFVPALRAVETATTNIETPGDETRLLAKSDPPSFAGAPLDAKTGGIEFFVETAGKAAQVAVSLFSFETGSYAPVYTDADGEPMKDATSGSSGGFVNLRPGIYVLTFANESGSCATRGGLNGSPWNVYQTPGSASIVVPVVEGYVTTPVSVDCSTANAAVGL